MTNSFYNNSLAEEKVSWRDAQNLDEYYAHITNPQYALKGKDEKKKKNVLQFTLHYEGGAMPFEMVKQDDIYAFLQEIGACKVGDLEGKVVKLYAGESASGIRHK